jgi:hypothetical protein
MLGFEGPLWFLPLESGQPLPGVTQVVGHSPVELYKPADRRRLAILGVHLTDPGAYRFGGERDTGGHIRCAVIEGGEVEALTRDPWPRPVPAVSLARYN